MFKNHEIAPSLQEALSYSFEEAQRLGNHVLRVEHLFLGILRQYENEAVQILKYMKVDLDFVKHKIEEKIRTQPPTYLHEFTELPIEKNVNNVLLKLQYVESLYFKSSVITTLHTLLGIIRDTSNTVSVILSEYGVTYPRVKNLRTLLSDEQLKQTTPENQTYTAPKITNPLFSMNNYTPPQEENIDDQLTATTTSTTPALDSFTYDLTRKAEEGLLDPVVGREKEVERLLQIICRRTKNNPILIGEPGVGKTAIVEGLALRIAEKKVSPLLLDKRILSLDLGSIVAGTRYRGQFESRMKAIITELTAHQNIILFVDEIHTIIGAGGASGSLDAANMLKPALARGELQCIGATTLNEYREHIEQDGALERRFQKIIVEQTNVEQTLEILKKLREKYGQYHHVTYSDEALEACVKLAERYITDKYFPDKAVDILDEVGARTHILQEKLPQKIIVLKEKREHFEFLKQNAVSLQDFEKASTYKKQIKEIDIEIARENEILNEENRKNNIITAEQVAEVVSIATGIPVQNISYDESQKLQKMEEFLNQRIIGQEEAVNTLVKSIFRNRTGIKDPSKPIGSFIFLGSTGIGKTLLAKELAKYLFDTSDALLRFDMSEYMEKFTVTRLIGAPPGYVGYKEGGTLTEKIRKKPYSVILFDEIEKAHPDVYHILLQILDEGVVTDAQGRKVDFKNTVIILTSNIGSQKISQSAVSFGYAANKNSTIDEEKSRNIVEKELKKRFTPEFLNRIDEVIRFKGLNKESAIKIINIELQLLKKRLAEQGYTLKISHKAIEQLVDMGYSDEYGARPLKRTIQHYVEDFISTAIINRQIKNNTITIQKIKEI